MSWRLRSSPVAGLMTSMVLGWTRIRGVGVVDADAEVVQVAGVAQGEFAESVDGVGSDAVGVLGCCWGRCGFEG